MTAALRGGEKQKWDYGLAIDNASGRREIGSVMRPPQRAAPKKLDYPEETPGSRLAAKARKLANQLTAEEEAEHFRRGMAKIYGGQPKEITGAGH